ncbi:cytochrome C oxidase subunit IV family protein [Protofrankia coriariae]|uniref:Cytochrome C oxidase subunit IV n=1 Tax=Protofrankia coriariae TaxID=1562887 RepID=A0ABR5F030_9ACTN|nr:cytochrome C oxidase subunit IV family protein [Protofrankia coriariae]KLL10054.1 hypothetical protein FrCorBMG51_20590 [Protofrankia coriariae]
MSARWDRLTAVWGTLMAATLASWAIGTQHGHDHDVRRLATVGVIIVAFAKVHLVGRHFMDLRGAPVLLKIAFTGWVVGVPATLVTIHLLRS